MSDEREDSLRGDSSGRTGGGKELASSALLVAGVVAILIAGFVLKAGRTVDPPEATPAEVLLGATITPETAAPESAPAPPPSPAPLSPSRLTPAAPAVTSGPADPTFDKLARRAAADLARVAAIREPWTAQLLVACRVETVERVLAASKGATKLYVLPAEVHGDACFRICWGAYKGAKDAAAATDLPRELRGRERVGAVEIAKVIR